MSNVKTYLDEAKTYFTIVGRNITGSNKLGNKTLLSLSSMIVEKYLVSYLMAKSIPIQGHSIKSLLTQMEKHLEGMPKELIGLSEIDERMDLCSLSAVSYSIPNDTEMKKIFDNLLALRNFVEASMVIE
jgi:hypothetical protein